MEALLIAAIEKEGYSVRRGHPYDEKKKHGFIDSQKYGLEVFRNIPTDAPLIVAEAVWQYSNHVMPGLTTHRGPILTAANWSGTWPGLVGMLNLNGSLTKAGVKYSTLWSEDFTDEVFLKGLRSWLKTGTVKQDSAHVKALKLVKVPASAAKIGKDFAIKLKRDKLIMGVFDEGCMGMFNAIIPDALLHPTGIFKERLSQSALYAKMLTVKDEEAQACFDWLKKAGLRFDFGKDEATELTEQQVLGQCKMYIAAVRIAAEFGCETIGIQYQQGLKDLTPASDLVEGLLNNRKRPPVFDETTGQELFKGEALPHFNEVDECAGLDAVVTYKLWRQLGYPPENTLHDIRWARQYTDKNLDAYVWIFLISGAAPAEHFGGYKNASSQRPAADVLSAGRRLAQWREQAGLDCLESCLCRWTQAEVRHRPGGGSEIAAGGIGRAPQADHAAVADYACGAAGRVARPDDGAPQEQPHPRGLRTGQSGGEERSLRQGRGDGGTGIGRCGVRNGLGEKVSRRWLARFQRILELAANPLRRSDDQRLSIEENFTNLPSRALPCLPRDRCRRGGALGARLR